MLQTCSDLVDQLKAYRLKVGLTQGDIGWKLGFASTTVSRWERGVATPDLRAIGAIVDFLRRANAQTEQFLIRSIQNARDSRNLWEGRDVRYLAGSPQEFRESPEMRAVVGSNIRGFLSGPYRDCIEDQAIVASFSAGEIASIDVYGGTALSMTSIPEGFVQMKRLSFCADMPGVIRGDTHSILIPAAEAARSEGVVIHSWDLLSRPV
ncbi:helix-turn-helix transcriptional regulator [Rhizobium sp. TRM95111]|uniref:helix-turn-helix domain-containing protein n=1 Tax=Rhizobium alarense TaxID=2846851 RepID=UPI001F2A8E08|nr:helix-turn-helix transcriptional regulator [Rhizobium alarense]MCF3641480.1 helix-turn-helix transcriptional regulator [Rhizobium alarense]